MRTLVTGGGGFIGSHLVEKLIASNHKVRVLDNFSTGKKENLSAVMSKIELIEGDIRDYCTVKHSVKGIDVIFHLAALPSVPRSIADPITSNSVNVDGTLNLLTAAKDETVKRFVFSSSSSVYGNSPTLPKTEKMVPNPLSPYAISKLTGEYYLKVFNNLYGIETVSLRYFNVFGPKQDPNSPYSAVIPKFISTIKNNEQPKIYGNGKQTRSFTYVSNVVEANLLAGIKNIQTPVVLNCANNNQVDLISLVSKINTFLGKKISAVYLDDRSGDIKHSWADISEIKRVLNFSPEIDFDEGLSLTIGYYMKNSIELYAS